MKTVFLLYGLGWLALAVPFACGSRGMWWAMVAAAVGSLWYVPVGTAVAVVQLTLLMMPQVRS